MTGEQPTRRLPPSQIYGWDYGGTKSLLIGVDSSGSIQASVAPSGTQDVRAIGTSTVVLAGTGSTVQVVGIFAGTQDVRTLNTSTVQIQAGTIDVRSITSSTVQVGGIAGTTDVRTISSSTVQAITKFAGVNYAPIHKNVIYLGSTAQAALWVPAAGLKINLTDVAISSSTAAQIDIVVGTSSVGPFFFAANGGAILNYNTPVLSAANGTMFVASTGGTVSFTAEGFEE